MSDGPRLVTGVPALAGALDPASAGAGSAPSVRRRGSVFVLTSAGARLRLSGYRARQPRRVAVSRDGRWWVWRVPFPSSGMPKCQRLDAAGSIVTLEWCAADFPPGGDDDRTGVRASTSALHVSDVDRPGCSRARAHVSVAARIRQVEEMRDCPAGTSGWALVSARFVQPLPHDYDPRTEALKKHADDLSPVLARIVRKPKTVLAREERIVPPGRVEHASRRTVKWLAGRPGRSWAERAKRGVHTEVRIADHDTRENRAVRDFAERTVREVRRIASASASSDRLFLWARECLTAVSTLRRFKVRELEPGAVPNQVLRMNPDYRRIWSAREDLIRQTAVEDALWGWQSEGWNELGLLVACVAVMNFEGWVPVVTPPLFLRLGQEQGRWLALRQDPFCALVESEGAWWLALHADAAEAGESGSFGEVPPGACCALTLGRTGDPVGWKAKLVLCVLGSQEEPVVRLDRFEPLAAGDGADTMPYDICVLTAQDTMPEVNPHAMGSRAAPHGGRVFALRMCPEEGLGSVMQKIRDALLDLRRRVAS